MKSRILKEIHLLASGAKSDHLEELVNETKLSEKELRRRAKIVRSLILHDYSHFTVLTNDTFFQRILRAFVKELGIDMNFSTELDTAPLLSKSVEVLIDNITENKDLRDWLEGLVEEQISDSGHWNIRKAITSLDKELFKESTKDIIAKNGDKKKLKQTIDEFNKVIAAALNQYKAKGVEALEKIYSRGYSHDNFNKGLTAYFDKVAEGTLLDVENATYIKRMTGSLDEWFTKTKKATPDLLALAGELQEMLVEVHSICTNLTTLENTRRILQKNYRGFALLHDLQKVVEEECREENSMLLSETKHAIAGFISESEAPFIYEKVGNYFDKFMIDEFQDTSFKEWRNFLPLLRNAMSQSTDTSVLIVGDVKQSIYRWRGGDWRILGGEIHRDLVDVSTVPLKNNWRSLPNIVEFNNALFTSAIERENTTLNAQLDEADAAHRISAECKAEL
jgi:ATP-dependent exoDNAse (exonuclease V) beta subunit